MKKIINILLDAIAWIIILFGGIATLIWLAAMVIFTGTTMTEFAILFAILVFIIWRIARWR